MRSPWTNGGIIFALSAIFVEFSTPLVAQDGILSTTFERQRGSVASLAYSPDGKILVSGRRRLDGKDTGPFATLWSVPQGKLITAVQGNKLGVGCLSFRTDGKSFASGGAGANLWNVATGENVAVSGGNWGVKAITFIADDKVLACGCFDGLIRLWDVSSGAIVTLDAHDKRKTGVRSLARSMNGKKLASGGLDNSIRIWEWTDAKNTHTWKDAHKYGVISLAFSPDGKTVASGGTDNPGKGGGGPPDGDIHLWDIESGQRRLTLTGHGGSVFSVAYSPDGKILASGSKDGTIKFWDMGTGKNTATLMGHTEDVYCVVFSPDGKTLASGGKDMTIRLWNVRVKP